MSPQTPTEARGMYTGTYLDKPVDISFPLFMPDRSWKATPATWDQIHDAQAIYQEVASRRFQQLVDQWLEDTINMSSIAARVAHPAYLEIIGMGEKAVPLLLSELEKRPSHWFPALTAITRENPIPEEARGRFKEMTEAWLEWGRENNYI
ncbi:hypothetical protein MYX64_03660 [Nitrospinae bacterium AH_259_B05_G02_I21]|nr:hypothetical protein [Nitrospinae bacterium AH_259_B05_G02_I21]MDA2932605.1 hypothetical protein [Nitrospinae bacterium AH-259-F20]